MKWLFRSNTGLEPGARSQRSEKLFQQFLSRRKAVETGFGFNPLGTRLKPGFNGRDTLYLGSIGAKVPNFIDVVARVKNPTNLHCKEEFER
jgi:hypothetical protein